MKRGAESIFAAALRSAEPSREFVPLHLAVLVAIKPLEPHFGAATQFLVIEFAVAIAVGDADPVSRGQRPFPLRPEHGLQF